MIVMFEIKREDFHENIQFPRFCVHKNSSEPILHLTLLQYSQFKPQP